MRCLMPGKTRRIGAVTPENIEPELVIDGTCDLQDNLSGMADNLTGHIYDSSAKRRRIAARVKHRLTDIDLETLVQEKRQKLNGIEGGIGRKTTKRKRFAGKVLEGSMDQLIASPLVIALQDGFSCQPPRLTGFCELSVDGLAAAQIGVKDGIGTSKFEPALPGCHRGDGSRESGEASSTSIYDPRIPRKPAPDRGSCEIASPASGPSR